VADIAWVRGIEVLEHINNKRRTRYRESRTLVRRLCRMPNEDRVQFRRKVARLRKHFEQFNIDTAELCQWIMGLRKRYVNSFENPDDADPASFGALGDFLLEPQMDDLEADEKTRDRWRLHVFDDVAGFRACKSIADQPVPQWLRDAMDEAAALRPGSGSKNTNAYKLFERLRALEPEHRLVLLKSAAEWIVARYLRGVENWKSHHEQWEREKAEWEAKHPELTEEIRNRFTDVFKQLKDDERDDKPGLRKKNPRLCRYERSKQNINNCVYAGQKGHGPLCWKYAAFVKSRKAEDGKFNDKAFWEAASILAELCQKHNIRKASNAFQSQYMLDSLYAGVQRRKKEKQKQKKGKGKPPKKQNPQQAAKAKADFFRIFKANWNAYLKAMGDESTGSTLNDTTAIEKGQLPHCQKTNEKFEKSKCEWNPHTDYCAEYKRRLEAMLDAETLKLEGTYRDWRKLYLAGPRKPQFRYPSSRDLPMPKVFGEGFHEIDFDNSVLRLRLDDMAEGEWMEFGFTPWPRSYTPSRKEIQNKVTSVHVNFIGNRARTGFRFAVEHRKSRLGVTQDEIDDLRSKRFPRQAEDQQFLNAANKRLFETFDGHSDRDMRILAVDMGMAGAHAALYYGSTHQADIQIPIHKFDKIYAELPEAFKDKKDKEGIITPDTRGLRKEHIGRHFEAIKVGAAKIAAKRQQETDSPMQTLRDADFRGLKRHIRWMIRDWARLNARQIIDIAEQHRCDVIVFESLRGKRLPGYEQLDQESERKKAEGVLNAYGRVRRKVTEKAVERGMRTVTVPYHKSSQVCHVCGKEQENSGLLKKNKLGKRKFICEHKECKVECNSDANAARVLARVFLKEIELPTPNRD